MWKPNLPYVDQDFPDRQDHVRLYGRVVARIGIVAQVCLVAVCAFGWLLVAGGSKGPLRVGLAAAILMALWIDRGIFLELKPPAPRTQGGYFGWLHLCGWACVMVTALVAVLVIERLSAMPVAWLLFSLLLGLLVGLVADISAHGLGPACHNLWLADKRRLTWRLVGIGIALTPIVSGWAIASLDIRISAGETDTIRAWLDEHPLISRPCNPWEADGRPIQVAVTLSGGGYRAALSHAGLLAALDDQCVPIQILSTVSGGSIAGAAYALGVPPREFAHRLARRQPALPDDLLSLFNVLADAPQKYQRHFERMFFGDRTIKDLPKSPKLLINVTNIDASPDYAREVITKDWAPHEADATRIADAVAASAAFPGVFGPVKFAWIGPERGSRLGAHFLVDGGVVENWGVEGLRQFLIKLQPDEWDQIHPSILIVSDASAYGQRPRKTPFEPAADEALSMANDIQFASSQHLTFTELTGADDLALRISRQPAWQQYTRIRYPRRYMPAGEFTRRYDKSSNDPLLSTIVIPITAVATTDLLNRYPSCVGPAKASASEVQQRVRAFRTLEELSTAQVEDAFWLGYALGTIYGQAIECARRESIGRPCTAEPELPVVRCPAL